MSPNPQKPTDPAARPPPGTAVNFVDAPSDAYIFHSVGGTLLAIMVIFIALRFYSKVVLWRRTTPDDWTALVAAIGTVGYFILCCLAIKHAKFGTHMWNVTLGHLMSDDFIVYGFFTNWVTAPIWAFAKTSFFIMYLQLFKPFKWVRWASYLGLFLNWGFYIAVTVFTLYFTAPAPGQSWRDSYRTSRYKGSRNTTIPIASGSLVLDVYILVIPLIALSRLQMSYKKKIGTGIVFATGLAACVASSLSIYYKVKLNGHYADLTYYLLPVLLMCVVEMCVGITCSSMPPCVRLLRDTSFQMPDLNASMLRPIAAIKSKFSQSSFGSRDGSLGWKSWRSRKGSEAKSSESNSELQFLSSEDVRTTINAGRGDRDAEEGKIRMDYSIEQELRLPNKGAQAFDTTSGK